MNERHRESSFQSRRRERRAADECEYREVLASLRHYSNLRFAIAGVFIAITGFLVAALYGKEPLRAPPEIGHILRGFGLVAAAAFGWIEFTLDGYINAFGKKAVGLCPNSHWAARPLRRKLVPVATMSMHAAAALFWVVSFWLPPVDEVVH